MEEHSGRSLGKFFDQWFHSPGYPDIKVGFKYDSKLKQGTFKVEQKQVDLEKGIPAFALSTDLGWTIAGNQHRLPVKLDEAKHIFVVDMAEEPEQVRFDPEHKVHHKLSFNPGDPMLRRQLTSAKDVIGRMQAAGELAKTAKRANIEAIVDAYSNESFWGVREEFANILAKANTEAAIEGLVKLIETEQDPKVVVTVFDAAGGYRDQRIQEAIGLRLQGELPYEARRAAFKAMGQQRRKADWDVLMAGSQEYGYKGIAQSGAFVGLASTRKEEAVDMLLKEVSYGAQDNRVRVYIVSALADIGQGLEKVKREGIIECLEDLLRDPNWNVTWSAVKGLLTMKASESISTIDAYGRAQSYQTKVWVDKFISSLKDEDKTDGSAVKKQVEDLDEKVRKLEEQLQKIAAKVEPASEEGDKEK
jgi:aminopeptidase N